MIANPQAREAQIWGVQALSELTQYQGLERIAVFDNATAALMSLEGVSDARVFIGDTLHDEEEAEALNGLVAALDCVTDVLGNGPLDEAFVNHRYVLAIVCSARYALAVLLRERPHE